MTPYLPAGTGRGPIISGRGDTECMEKLKKKAAHLYSLSERVELIRCVLEPVAHGCGELYIRRMNEEDNGRWSLNEPKYHTSRCSGISSIFSALHTAQLWSASTAPIITHNHPQASYENDENENGGAQGHSIIDALR